MPQLDSNTFIYQYTGIIFLFIATYFILSYVVLPLLLRAVLLRNMFLSVHATLSNLTTVVSSSYSHMLSTSHTDHSNMITGRFFKINAQLLIAMTSLLSSGHYFEKVNSVVKSINTLTTNFFLLYLNFFILTDYETE